MSALVQALGLAPVPDFDAAGLVKDVDRSLARHSLTAGWRWSEDILVGSGKHFHSTTCASSFVLSAGKVSTRRRPLLVEAHDATACGVGFFQFSGTSSWGPAAKSSAMGAGRWWRPLSAGRRPKARNGRTPPSRVGSARRATGNDFNRYFQRKSQIFGEDCASRAT